MVDMGAYTDNLGFLVDVGTVVGYREEFDNLDMSDKAYIVRGLPDYGNMVEMSECELDESGNPVNVDETVITVEPWKIGAI